MKICRSGRKIPTDGCRHSLVPAGTTQLRDFRVREGCPGATTYVNAGSAWILSPACHFRSRSPLTDLFTMSPATVGCLVRGSLPRSTARRNRKWPSGTDRTGFFSFCFSGGIVISDGTHKVINESRLIIPVTVGRWSDRRVAFLQQLACNTSSLWSWY